MSGRREDGRRRAADRRRVTPTVHGGEHAEEIDDDLLTVDDELPVDDDELLAGIDAELAAEEDARRRAPARTAGAVLLFGSLVSWIASLVLLVEKLHLVANPGSSLVCDINPFISCGSVMMTWQASAFGFPNMAIGLGGFAVMGAAGSLLLAGTALPDWFRWAVLGGMTFAVGFVHFLALSAIFDIRALCLWCMIVWAMTAPMFFVTLAHMIEDGALRPPRAVAGVLRRWVALTVTWYAVVMVTIFLAFMPQWLAMAGLG